MDAARSFRELAAGGEHDFDANERKAFGRLRYGGGQFRKPLGIATGPKGEVWVADSANNRVEELSSEGS